MSAERSLEVRQARAATNKALVDAALALSEAQDLGDVVIYVPDGQPTEGTIARFERAVEQYREARA